jgi:4-hydroxybenzoate polyprenyltransferase
VVSENKLTNQFTGFNRLKLFLALSRTPHGLIDMATPAFAALLWLGQFPSLGVIVMGLVTTFAGYTSVYALNDVIDYRHDKAKAAAGGFHDSHGDLDAVLIRHPMAQGLLSFSEGLVWSLGWGTVALLGAYYLNPVCVLIFLGGCLLEAVYCLLWNVSPYRTLISGAVKTSGAMAAVFAVDPNPSWGFLVVLFLCLFCWEIGGQNIPNDWTDIVEDGRHHARTLPLRLGPDGAAAMILGTLLLTLAFLALAFNLGQKPADPGIVLLALLVSVVLCILPALKLLKVKNRTQSMILFNRASYFPLAMLGMVLLGFAF